MLVTYMSYNKRTYRDFPIATLKSLRLFEHDIVLQQELHQGQLQLVSSKRSSRSSMSAVIKHQAALRNGYKLMLSRDLLGIGVIFHELVPHVVV